MALNALDIAVAERDPLKKGIMMAMFKSALPSPMDRLPVETANALTQQVIRMTDPGSPSTRNLNDTVTAYQAQFTRGQETLKIIENKVTVDPVFMEQKNYVQDPVQMQITAYGKVVRTTVNDLLINGDPGSDVTQPAGLDYRLRNDAMFSGQAIDGGALNVDADEASRLLWLRHIDNAIVRANGIANICIVNTQTWVQLRSVLRTQRLLDTTKDQFDRMIMAYGNTQILDAGQKPAGVITGAVAQQVIADDGITGIFGDASSTPMYFLNTEGDEGARLLQLSPFKAEKLGINPNSPSEFVIDLRWVIGFLLPVKFCLSSVDGLDIS